MQRLMERPGPPGGGDAAPTRAPPDVMTRVYSALILASVALFMTFTSVASFALLIAMYTVAMAWEWGRLVRGEGLDAAFAAQVATTFAACLVTVLGCPACAILTVILGAALVFLLRLLRDARPQAWWSATGVYYAGLPAVSLIWVRGDAEYGVIAILYLFAIVWTTDSAAFLFGRWIGGPKLAPLISPKKTWAGLIGGTLSSALAGAIFGLIAGLSSLWLGGLAIALALIAQLGDLGESAVKRIFGRKDTSSLIPGHGGVLDRIDGLIFAAVTAGVIALSFDPAHPGRALLIWH